MFHISFDIESRKRDIRTVDKNPKGRNAMKNLLAIIVLVIFGGACFYAGTMNRTAPIVITKTMTKEIPVAACAPLPPLHKGHSKYVEQVSFLGSAIPMRLLRAK